MENLIRLESIREFRTPYSLNPRSDDDLYLVSGKLMREVRTEMDRGDRARWLLEELVALGSKDGSCIST